MQTPVLESLFNKVAGLRLATLLKIRLQYNVSFEYGKIFKSTYFQ